MKKPVPPYQMIKKSRDKARVTKRGHEINLEVHRVARDKSRGIEICNAKFISLNKL